MAASNLSAVRQRLEAEVQKRTAAVARAKLAEVERTAHPDSVTTSVDGVEGADLDRVKPGGTITFRFGYLSRVVAAALDLLQGDSPADTGEYRSAHAAYVDGASTDPARIGSARRVLVANTLSYARIVEVGAHGRAPWSRKEPTNGPYHAAAQDLSRRFAGMAKVSFMWIAADRASMSPTTSRTARYPALLIEAPHG